MAGVPGLEHGISRTIADFADDDAIRTPAHAVHEEPRHVVLDTLLVRFLLGEHGRIVIRRALEFREILQADDPVVRRDPCDGIEDGIQERRLPRAGPADDEDILPLGDGLFEIFLVIRRQRPIFDIIGKREDLEGLFTQIELLITDDRRKLALETGFILPDFRLYRRDLFIDDLAAVTGDEFDEGPDLIRRHVAVRLDLAFRLRLVTEVSVVVDIDFGDVLAADQPDDGVRDDPVEGRSICV